MGHLFNLGHEIDDFGVDSRFSLLGASDSPRSHSNQSHLSIGVGSNEWTTAVSLATVYAANFIPGAEHS